MIPEIILARHGETEWNRAGRFQGTLDSPLTALGRAQAAALTPLMREAGVTGAHSVFTSPQGRSVATAALALAPFGIEAQQDSRLVEIGVGDWTGLTRAEIDAGWPPLDPHEHFLESYARAPNGEGFEALFARGTAFLSGLREPTMIFTHGITSRVLRTIAMGWGQDRLAELPGGQGVLHVVRDRQHETREP